MTVPYSPWTTVLVGKVVWDPWFGFIPLTNEVEYRSVVRLAYQP